MLPNITPTQTLDPLHQEFLIDLRKTTFTGEIHTDYAARLSLAVDNSIYQVIPQAVIFPRSSADIAEVLQLSHQQKYHHIQFCPRGGGTSTNGQSLSAGIMLDCSKHIREILEVNLAQQWVRVQPGVVLDQLNAHLKPHDVCFAPEISPSNRATIGGMVNTDACGTGSRVVGRTRDHVLDLTCVLATGEIIHSAHADALQQKVAAMIEPHQALVDEKFTSAPRTLNGYNLQGSTLNHLLCGSEGTLAVISECKLKLTPIPKFKKLLVVKYRCFDDALRAVEITQHIKPFAIEAIDEKLIALARKDSLYFYIKDFIDDEYSETKAVNLVEFVGNDEAQLENTVAQFTTAITKNKHLPKHALGFYIAKDTAEIKLLWELRKKSVGLISKELDGTRRPIPFIEDTAVPPEKLADYISEFKALLDRYHLHYGMYGHVDAGCVHVRPALDMKLQNDEKLIQQLSDEVVALIEKYDGVLWGEHGQGYRSVYAERFFGETLYQVVRQIKTLFDPYNQLNPGKIATSLSHQQALVKLEGPMRGEFDKQIPEAIRNEFNTAIACNGNGACFNYATADVMCPSYKVTKDRVHSPKGRATLMREWLRQLAIQQFIPDVNKCTSVIKKLFIALRKKPDFSQEVYQAMAGCLSCKACAGCPLNVDVPEFKAKFLAIYHQRYLRPLRDYLIASVEKMAPWQAKWPRVFNFLLQNTLSRFVLRVGLRITDVPVLGTVSLKKELKKRKLASLASAVINQPNSVILLQDAFTSFYQPQIFLDCYDFLTRLGFTVFVPDFFPSGKPLHVKGFLSQFTRTAKQNCKRLAQLAKLNIPIVGIDPSVTLTYRDEYQKLFGRTNFHVYLLQEWLAGKLAGITPTAGLHKQHYLLSHCTEKTLCIETEKLWQTIYAAFGCTLMPLNAGCCGMAGSYGHETEHLKNSRALFDMDWQQYVTEHPQTLVATGYSCRSQAKRFEESHLQHPIQVLAHLLK